MKSVSVGIPTFKPKINLIKKTIDSIISQDYENITIIISENAPLNDELKNYIKNFNIQKIDIQYFEQKKFLSQIDNWDFVIKKASTEYLLICGDDDTLSKNYISSSVKILESDNNIYAVGTRWFHTFEDGTKSVSGGQKYNYKSKYSLFRATKYLFEHNDIFVMSLMKTEIAQKVGFKKTIKKYWWPNRDDIANVFTQFILKCLLYGKGTYNHEAKYEHRSITFPRIKEDINLMRFIIQSLSGYLRYTNLYFNFFLILVKFNIFLTPIYFFIVLFSLIKIYFVLARKIIRKLKRYFFNKEKFY